jgi:hypothetical protein
MNYAIQVLENEKALIEKALSKWECENYPEAKKERTIRLMQLNNAIIKLKDDYENNKNIKNT